MLSVSYAFVIDNIHWHVNILRNTKANRRSFVSVWWHSAHYKSQEDSKKGNLLLLNLLTLCFLVSVKHHLLMVIQFVLHDLNYFNYIYHHEVLQCVEQIKQYKMELKYAFGSYTLNYGFPLFLLLDGNVYQLNSVMDFL